MHAKFRSPLMALPLIVALASPGLAEEVPSTPLEGVVLSATLSGTGGGDSDGTGSFSGRLDQAKGAFCYSLNWSAIDEPTMAHIHKGSAGATGPVFIGLPEIDPGEHCIDLDDDRASALKSKPGNYYVNIHNGDFPQGAIRGQLVKE